MEKNKIIGGVPWWIIPIVVIIPFVGAGTSLFLSKSVGSTTDLGEMGIYHHFNASMVLVCFFIGIINMWIGNKFKLSPTTFAILHASLTIAAVYGCTQYPWHTFSRLLVGTRYIDSYGLAAKYMPSWWMISKDACAAFMQPGSVSPEWGPVILFWWFLGSSLFFLLLGFSLLLRYQWYDVENLPYPYAQVALESIRMASDPSKPQTKKIITGAIVGMLVILPVIIRMFFKWFPDIYQWYNTQVHTTEESIRVDLVFPALYRSVVGLTAILDNPLYIALAFFIPLNTLLSAVFFYFVYIIIGTQIAWYMGYYTGIETAAWGTRQTMLRNMPPINVTGVIEHGLLPMILIMSIVLNWRSIILRPLRLAFGSGTESEKEIERREPVSYRIALMIIVFSAAIIVLLLMVSGFPFDDALIWLGVACLYQLAYARTRGLAGPISLGVNVGPAFIRWKYPGVTMATVPRGFYLFGLSHQAVVDGNAMFGRTNYPIFETWRVGIDLGANYKLLFKSICIAGLMAPLFGILGYVVVVSRWGHQHLPLTLYGLWDSSSLGMPGYMYTAPASPVWPYMLSGALLAVFLSYMRFKFAWWPLDPVGAFIGCGGTAVKNGFGFAFLIAFIIKYIVLKVGGSKTYTDTAVPFATGFIIGYAIMGIVGRIIGTVIFFMPI